MHRLAIIVLGHRNAGKTKTWNDLFERVVRTGKEVRALELSKDVTVPVFLVSGSPEERRQALEKIVPEESASIVLCSLQYKSEARDSIAFFIEHGYTLWVQWLNPGYSDDDSYPDSLGFADYLLYAGATVSIRSGKGSTRTRVREIRAFLTGWFLQQ
ncbi:MAG: GTPase [Gemmatimonadaceae bacterium]